MDETEEEQPKCARCGRTAADEAEFTHAWVLGYEQDADFPYCPNCVAEIKRDEGRVVVADPEVGSVWLTAPRGEG